MLNLVCPTCVHILPPGPNNGKRGIGSSNVLNFLQAILRAGYDHEALLPPFTCKTSCAAPLLLKGSTTFARGALMLALTRLHYLPLDCFLATGIRPAGQQVSHIFNAWPDALQTFAFLALFTGCWDIRQTCAYPQPIGMHTLRKPRYRGVQHHLDDCVHCEAAAAEWHAMFKSTAPWSERTAEPFPAQWVVVSDSLLLTRPRTFHMRCHAGHAGGEELATVVAVSLWSGGHD